MTKILSGIDFQNIPIANLVLQHDATLTSEGQITYNSSLGKLQYRDGSSTITIDNTSGSGGSGELPSTEVEDESGNSSHTIDFTTVKYYTGCTGDISLSLTSAVDYPITQILEHVSTDPLNILPSDDYAVYGIGDLDYNNDGETVNIILIYFVDGHTDSNGKQVIRVSCANQPIIPTASSVTILGSAAGAPFTGTYDVDNGTENTDYTIYQIVKSTTGSDPFTVVSTTDSYTPTIGEDGEYLKFRVKPAITIGNVIHYASQFFESNYAQISGSVTTETFDAQTVYTSGTEAASGSNAINPDFDGTDADYVLLSDAGDEGTFTITLSGTPGSARLDMLVRTGNNISSTNYVTPMDYVITVNGTEYSSSLSNGFEYDSDTGETATDDFGSGQGYIGYIYKTVPLTTGANTIKVKCTSSWAGVANFKFTY